MANKATERAKRQNAMRKVLTVVKLEACVPGQQVPGEPGRA